MSHRKRLEDRSSSWKNLILKVICFLLAALLAALLWMNENDKKKKLEEPQALNEKFYQEEQENAAALKQKEAEDRFSQCRIMVVSDDCTAEKEIRIVFSSKEQADGFRGMCFSWK